jgi:hypothetical protein
VTSIKDVARSVGVSTATVSRALRGLPRVSDETRDRVLQAAADLDYVASPSAAGLASGQTRSVGVIVPFVTRWFYAGVVQGAEELLRAAGYDLLLYNLGGDRDARHRVFRTHLLRKRVDAVLVLSLTPTDEEVEALTRTDRPVVVVGASVPGCGVRELGSRWAARMPPSAGRPGDAEDSSGGLSRKLAGAAQDRPCAPATLPKRGYWRAPARIAPRRPRRRSWPCLASPEYDVHGDGCVVSGGKRRGRGKSLLRGCSLPQQRNRSNTRGRVGGRDLHGNLLREVIAAKDVGTWLKIRYPQRASRNPCEGNNRAIETAQQFHLNRFRRHGGYRAIERATPTNPHVTM